MFSTHRYPGKWEYCGQWIVETVSPLTTLCRGSSKTGAAIHTVDITF